MKRQRIGLLIVGLLVVSVLATTAMVSHTTRAAADAWSVVPAPSSPYQDDYLYGVSAVSANDVWAVGDYDQGCYFPCFTTLTQHWNGSNWSIVPSPSMGESAHLQGVAAVSSTVVWAVGYSSDTSGVETPLILKWDGSQWNVIPSPYRPGENNRLMSVAVVNATEVWAVGYSSTNTTSRTLTMKWDGTSWRIYDSPSAPDGVSRTFPVGTLYGVAASASDDVEAVGAYQNGNVRQTLVLIWDPVVHVWLAPATPNVGTSQNILTSITIDTPFNSAWAVGYASDTGSPGLYRPLILRRSNSTFWTVSNISVSATPAALTGVAIVNSNFVPAIGYQTVNQFRKTLSVRWNGSSWLQNGADNASNYHNILFGITVVPGTNPCAGGDLWAVGNYNTLAQPYPLLPLIERYTITPTCNQNNHQP